MNVEYVGYAYVVLILSVTIAVLRIGDRDARVAIITLLTGSGLTLASVVYWGSYFEGFNPLLVTVDSLVLAIFMLQALVSRRYWPMALPMLQLINVATHIASLIAPEIVPDVYSAGQGFWAYWQMLIIVTAAIYHRKTRRKSLQ
jgi:hypothetical protein